MTNRFRIYPVDQCNFHRRDKKYWFDVLIYKNRKEFKKKTKLKRSAACTSSLPGKAIHDIFLNCIGRFRKGEKWKKGTLEFPPGKIGDMVFMEGYLTDEIITHECTHAMFRTVHNYTDIIHLWMYETHLSETEEYMCYLVSSYFDQIKKELKRTPKI
jgi:hypothetical protein